MYVKDLMTRRPACCRPDMPLVEVARLMLDADCGALPVVERGGRPIGVITDRDIACRAVAFGQDAREISAADCMSAPCVTISKDARIESCCKLLERNQIRRCVVVDELGRVTGMIALADIAQVLSREEVAELVRAVSRHGSPIANQRAEIVSHGHAHAHG